LAAAPAGQASSRSSTTAHAGRVGATAPSTGSVIAGSSKDQEARMLPSASYASEPAQEDPVAAGTALFPLAKSRPGDDIKHTPAPEPWPCRASSSSARPTSI